MRVKSGVNLETFMLVRGNVKKKVRLGLSA